MNSNSQTGELVFKCEQPQMTELQSVQANRSQANLDMMIRLVT